MNLPNLSPRTKFVLMFILFAMPITASYLTFFFWKPKATANFGELIAPVIALPEEKFVMTDGKDAPTNAGDKALRGKWLIVTRDSGACDQACSKKLYTMRQARLILGKELDRVARVMLIDDAMPLASQISTDFAGTAFVSAKDSGWLSKLPRETNDATGGRGYFYAVDPMGNLFMRYKADEDIKELAADFRRVLKASQLGKDLEGQTSGQSK
jgi:cytochrome oxidase Cu insertion factor (SCO1/SenC/PrrC family)